MNSSPQDALYHDRWIACLPDQLQIRGYYFPWGTKHIPYREIRGVRRVRLGAFTGQGRIWGTANPHYWAHLDPGRPGKTSGLVLDLGKAVSPYITPEDTDAVEQIIREKAGLGPESDGPGPGPII